MNDTEKPGNAAATGAPSGNLKSVVLVNFLWMFGGNGLGAVLKIIVLLVLARLLTPEDFGVVSAALTVVALAELLGRVGVVPFIVRTQDLTDLHIHTGTTITIALGVVIGLIIFLTAGMIADLYQIDGLEPIIQVFSIYFPLHAIGMVSMAVLERRMAFKVISATSVISYLFGYAVVAVICAALGLGPWSLVAAQIAQAAIQTASYQYFARLGLPFGFDWRSFTTMIRFGFGVTLTQLGNYVASNADYMIVGRFLGATLLGHYSRAYLLLMQPAAIIGAVGDKVLFPALSSVQDDRPRMVRALNQTLALCAMTQIPLSVLLVVIGPEVVLILMGNQYDLAIVPFQILISALFFRTGLKFLTTAFRATGYVYLSAVWQWSYAGLIILCAFLGLNWGLPGVAAAVSIAIVLTYLIGATLIRTVVGISLASSATSLLRYVLIGIVQLGLSIWVKSMLVSNGAGSIAIFLSLSLLTFLVYLALFRFMPKAFGAEGQVLDEFARKALAKRKNR